MQERLFDIDTALLTPRTVVRRFREEDGPQVYQLILNNMPWLNDFHSRWIEAIHTPADAGWYVRTQLAAWLTQQSYHFGVWDKDQAELIGLVRIFDIDWQIPKSFLEFFIAPEFSQKGIMTEVLLKVTDFAFDELKLEKLNLKLAMDNYAGQRLARKCGFRREGDLRSEFKMPGGELIDILLMAAYASDFRKAGE